MVCVHGGHWLGTVSYTHLDVYKRQLILTAAYTDDGKQATMPRLRGEGTVVLHSRRKKAALYDENYGMADVEHAYG